MLLTQKKNRVEIRFISLVRTLQARNMAAGNIHAPHVHVVNLAAGTPRESVVPSAHTHSIDTGTEPGFLRVTIAVSGHSLEALDVSNSSDPYLVFQQNGKEIGRTEILQKNLNPVWSPLTMKLQKDCKLHTHTHTQRARTHTHTHAHTHTHTHTHTHAHINTHTP